MDGNGLMKASFLAVATALLLGGTAEASPLAITFYGNVVINTELDEGMLEEHPGPGSIRYVIDLSSANIAYSLVRPYPQNPAAFISSELITGITGTATVVGPPGLDEQFTGAASINFVNHFDTSEGAHPQLTVTVAGITSVLDYGELFFDVPDLYRVEQGFDLNQPFGNDYSPWPYAPYRVGSNLIVTRVTAGFVPETASWIMMAGGFGLIGGAIRYRRKQLASFA